MFKLKSLTIRNLFQYKEANIPFSSQINLIVGANGSGKTNILNCIYYAITGDLPFKKELCIRRNADSNDAYVILVLDFKGKELVITRNLKEKAKAIFDGKEFFGNAEIASLLQGIGLKRNVFDNCIFLRQGEIRKFINATPKERIQLFLEILDIKKLDRLYQELGIFIKENTAKYSIDYSQEYNKYLKLKTEYDSLHNTRTLEELLEIKKKQNQLEHIKFQLRRKHDELRNICNKLNEIEADLAALASIEGIDINLSPSELDRAAKYCQNLIDYKDHFRRLLKKWQQRCGPVIYSEKDLIDIDKEISILERESKQIYQNINILKSKKACPLCLRPIDEDDLFARLKKEYMQKQLLKQQKEKIKEELEEKKLKYERRRDIYSEIAKLKEEKKSLFAIKYDIQNPERFLAEYKTIRELSQKRLRLLQEKDVLSGRIEQCRNEIFVLQDEKDALERAIPKDIDVDEEIKLCNRKKELELLLKEKEKYVALKEEIEIKKTRLQDIDCVRNYLRYNNIPQAILAVFFEKFVNTINSFLEKLDANFRLDIEYADELIFHILYKNGAIFSDRQLSYGEQLLLALSIATSFVLLLSDIKILILDEPTLGLDEDHVKSLSLFLTTLQELGLLQVLCATHETALMQNAYLIRTESLSTATTTD